MMFNPGKFVKSFKVHFEDAFEYVRQSTMIAAIWVFFIGSFLSALVGSDPVVMNTAAIMLAIQLLAGLFVHLVLLAWILGRKGVQLVMARVAHAKA